MKKIVLFTVTMMFFLLGTTAFACDPGDPKCNPVDLIVTIDTTAGFTDDTDAPIGNAAQYSVQGSLDGKKTDCDKLPTMDHVGDITPKKGDLTAGVEVEHTLEIDNAKGLRFKETMESLATSWLEDMENDTNHRLAGDIGVQIGSTLEKSSLPVNSTVFKQSAFTLIEGKKFSDPGNNENYQFHSTEIKGTLGFFSDTSNCLRPKTETHGYLNLGAGAFADLPGISAATKACIGADFNTNKNSGSLGYEINTSALGSKNPETGAIHTENHAEMKKVGGTR